MYQIDEVKELGNRHLYEEFYSYIESQMSKQLVYRIYENIFGHSVNVVLSTVIERMAEQNEFELELNNVSN